jgi:hypothetical protein
MRPATHLPLGAVVLSAIPSRKSVRRFESRALVRWFQRLCLTGSLASAEPKALRWRIWHAPARLVRSGRSNIMGILDGWPDAEAILGANRRIARLT